MDLPDVQQGDEEQGQVHRPSENACERTPLPVRHLRERFHLAQVHFQPHEDAQTEGRNKRKLLQV